MPQPTPGLVTEALQAADELGFDRSCSPETGRLLRALVGHVSSGVIAEIGTGVGVGAAWMASGLQDGVAFVTVEIDHALAQAARTVLADVPAARVIAGDWREILSYGPFALLFADAGAAKQREPETLLEVLQPGGMIVLDDLTPGGTGEPDPVRDFWLNDPRVAATEFLLSPREAAVLATHLAPSCRSE